MDCISPSLPHSAFHVVIAGHAENTCYQYVLDMGLTNALVVVYRRVSPEEPLRTWTGRCGIRVEEKLLVPNHGRDAAAFYDYLLEHYNSPPVAMAFLHSHGPFDPVPGRQDPETVTSRLVGYYKALVNSDPIAEHVVTLKSPSADKSKYDGWWSHRRLLFPNFDVLNSSDPVCYTILDRYNVSAPEKSLESCCASFIMPGGKMTMYPYAMYLELRNYVLTAPDDQQTARECFEYIVYRIYHEKPLGASKHVLEWYKTLPSFTVERKC